MFDEWKYMLAKLKYFRRKFCMKEFFRTKSDLPIAMRCRFGRKNKEKIYLYITDLSSEGSGIFSMFKGILFYIAIADYMGWIPIIDESPELLRKNKVTFRKDRNVMNQYFEFHNNIPSEEVFSFNNVILNSTLLYDMCPKAFDRAYAIYESFPKGQKLHYLHQLCKSHLELKGELASEVEKKYEQLFAGKERILGVAIREGKMFMNEAGRLASGEQEQPDIDTVINTVRKYYDIWDCQCIYLSCETEWAINIFRREFGEEKVVYMERIRIDINFFCDIKSMRDGIKKVNENDWYVDKYDTIDREYIMDMELLSRCDCAILPENCGTLVAYLKANGYNNKFLKI